MQKVILLIFGIVFLSFLSGCSSSWKITRETSKNRYYTFVPPQHWMLLKKEASTLLSCHGTTIDRILLLRRSIMEPLPNTQLQIKPEMLPHELGGLIYSRAVATPGVSNVILREIAPAIIDSKPGVRCVLDYRINEILFTDVVYGFIYEFFLYELRLSSTKRYYLDENLDHFESVVRSFRLRK
jgi:hypothetical protein